MNRSSSDNHLNIFIKYPEPGKVKTRIASKIGHQNAADFYSLIAKMIVHKFDCGSLFETNIFFDPPDRENDIKKWLGKYKFRYYPQLGNTLGEKLFNAFQKSLSIGGKNIITIGSDCTSINIEDVQSGFKTLGNKSSHAVIGPATDGGYYLIGLNTLKGKIFENIEWSTEKVMASTIDRLNTNNLTYTLLRELTDIDEADDIDVNLIKSSDRILAERIYSSLKGVENGNK